MATHFQPFSWRFGPYKCSHIPIPLQIFMSISFYQAIFPIALKKIEIQQKLLEDSVWNLKMVIKLCKTFQTFA